MRLYDMVNDPLELNDLAKNPDYSKTRSDLFKQLLQLQKEMNDPIDLSNYFGEM